MYEIMLRVERMTTTGLQLLGFVLGVFSWAGMLATGASPEWRKNSVGGTALDQHKRLHKNAFTSELAASN